MDSRIAPSTKPLYRGTQIVWYVVGVLEAVLAFRFLLKMFGANVNAGFTDFVYTISYPFVAPFLAVFGKTQVAGSTLEWTTILAMVVYWLIALAIIKALTMSRAVSTPEAAAKLTHDV